MMHGSHSALVKLKQLSEQIREQNLREEERLKAQHGRFNLFTILLSAHDEVRLHTRFLHELLNPQGTHDCGDLFLKLFIETLSNHPPVNDDGTPFSEDWDEYLQACAQVQKEFSTKEFGQLDLLLEFESSTLVIENKIWAGEQDRQLARYIDFLGEKSGHVLYLTLEGKEATTHEGKRYLRISYREHITEWLERCLKSTYSIVPINQVLIQYKKVLKQLLGRTVEENYMKETKQFLRSNPEIVANQQSINTAVAQLRVEVLEEFAQALIKSLSDELVVTLRPDMTQGSFGVDKNGGLIVTSPKYPITTQYGFEIWVENIGKWSALVIGIESNWKKRVINEHEALLLEKIRKKLLQHSEDSGLHNSKVTETWGGTYWPVGWHDLICGFMADDITFSKMLNPVFFEEQVAQAEQGIRQYMALLHSFYQEAISEIQ